MSQDALLTPREAAELVGVEATTVRRWVREGYLPALRLGDAVNAPLRIRVSDLTAQLTLAGPPKENR
jgi:excisionase family DNA binding protein